MQVQDTTTAYLYRLWPWVEANKNRIILGGGIIIVAVLLISFHIWQREQKEIAAGQALTRLVVSAPPNANPSQLAELYLKTAETYAGTLAGQRALLRGAATLFEAGRFSDAQTQFQKFLNQYSDSAFTAQAALGVAASLDAQGKTELAAGAYQHVINGPYNKDAAAAAKFALARIYEQQGRLTEAKNLYEDVAHSNPRSSMGQEAGLRAEVLNAKSPAVSPPAPPAVPANPKS